MEPVLRIEGERLYLRPIEPEEALSLLAGGEPAGLVLAQGYPGQASMEVMDIFVGERRDDSLAFTPFFIVRREDDAIVGEIGYSLPDGPAAPVAGYDVVEPLWGRGYATEALQALIGHLFGLPGVDRVCADTLKAHVASRRVMEKSGMKLVREDLAEVDGEMQDVVYYEVARERA